MPHGGSYQAYTVRGGRVRVPRECDGGSGGSPTECTFIPPTTWGDTDNTTSWGSLTCSPAGPTGPNFGTNAGLPNFGTSTGPPNFGTL